MLLSEGPNVVGHPVNDDRDRQEGAADHDAEREHVQRQLVHQRCLWIGRGLGALPGDRGPAVEIGGNTGKQHQRNRHCGNGWTAENGKCLQAVLLSNRRTDRGAEQVRVEEVADIGHAEHIVAQRPVLLHRQTQPADARLSAVERHQDVVQPQEHRDLREHRQAAKDRVEAVFALKFLHLQRHPLAVLAVLFLQGFDLGLQFLHLAGGANLSDERLVQQGAQGEDEEHHRQRPCEKVVGAQQNCEKLVPQPHDPGHRVVDVVEAQPVKHARS